MMKLAGISGTVRRLLSALLAAALALPAFVLSPTLAVAADAGNTIATAFPLTATQGSRSDSVNAGGDNYDVFRIELQPGEKLAVNLTTTVPKQVDIDIDLLPPGSSQVTSEAVFYSRNVLVYPEAMTYVVPPSGGGVYFVVVEAESGYGPYTLQWKKLAVAADDDIRGVEASSPVTGNLNRYGDQDDVFRVNVDAGKTLRASLTGPTTSDFDLFGYGPGAESVYRSNPASESIGLTSVEKFDLLAPTTGEYYIDVYSAYGAGSYTLSYAVGYPTEIALSAPGVIPYGGSAKLAGRLRLKETGSDLASQTVTLQYRGFGGTRWETLRQVSTDASGTFSATVKPKYRTEYRAVYRGLTNERLATTSAVRAVRPQAALSKPRVPSTIRKGRTFTVTGVLKPRYPQGARVVRIQAQHLESGKWVTRRWATATTLKPDSTASWFKASMSVPYSRKWRVRAVLPTNSRNSYSAGAWTYFWAK